MENSKNKKKCRRCGAKLRDGIAIQNFPVRGDDGTWHLSMQSVLVDCLKCPKCGESYEAVMPKVFVPKFTLSPAMKAALKKFSEIEFKIP